MVAGGLIIYGIPLAMFGVVIYPNVFEIIGMALLVGTLIGGVNGLLSPSSASLRSSRHWAPCISHVARPCCCLPVRPFLTWSAGRNSAIRDSRCSARVRCSGFRCPSSFCDVALIAAWVAGRTPLGRQVYAVGGNERASLLSGVYVDRVKIIVYMIAGFCAAIAGLVVASQLVASHPASGTTFEMNAIAAAVLGGTSLAGGRGTIGGTVVGAFVIGVLSDGLVMMGVSEFWQM